MVTGHREAVKLRELFSLKGLNQRWAKLSSSTLKHRWHCDQQPARKQQITTPEQTQCDVWDERGQERRRKRSRFHSFLLAAPWSRAYKTQNHLYFFLAFVFRCLRLFLFLSDITFLSLGQSARTGEGLKYCMETQTHTHSSSHFYANIKELAVIVIEDRPIASEVDWQKRVHSLQSDSYHPSQISK